MERADTVEQQSGDCGRLPGLLAGLRFRHLPICFHIRYAKSNVKDVPVNGPENHSGHPVLVGTAAAPRCLAASGAADRGLAAMSGLLVVVMAGGAELKVAVFQGRCKVARERRETAEKVRRRAKIGSNRANSVPKCNWLSGIGFSQ
jgi:hypothetical protein